MWLVRKDNFSHWLYVALACDSYRTRHLRLKQLTFRPCHTTYYFQFRFRFQLWITIFPNFNFGFDYLTTGIVFFSILFSVSILISALNGFNRYLFKIIIQYQFQAMVLIMDYGLRVFTLQNIYVGKYISIQCTVHGYWCDDLPYRYLRTNIVFLVVMIKYVLIFSEIKCHRSPFFKAGHFWVHWWQRDTKL